jgi:mannose-6-phosphate isomerase-like protein (cupin superfamily)
MSLPRKINVTEKLDQFEDLWAPKIVGEMNDDKVQVVKLKGDFVWHKHDKEDELFYVLKGNLKIHFRDGVVELSEGELVIVPHGVEHKPEAEEEVHILLIEPKEVLNTGDAKESDLTNKAEQI